MQDKPLRSGFTTGTCGAAAAKAAAVCLLGGECRERITIMTPRGILADMAVVQEQVGDVTWFRVEKDAGDDPDVTDKAWIYGSVQRILGDKKDVWYQSEEFLHLYLTGGEGIGMVTRAGLACPVGKHAINPVPRRMIFNAVQEVCQEMDCQEELLIQIQIPAGVALAARTFNPKLGIAGGISVLGTSGIVEPMSEKALLATIRLELHMKAVEGADSMILTPGNYGEKCLKEQLHLSLDRAVKCSNFIKDAMGMAAQEGFRHILFVGHLGKMIKVAGGVGNTHSQYGDRRMEILADCLTGHGDSKLRDQILSSNTTEDALDSLQAGGCREAVMKEAGRRIQAYLTDWGFHQVEVEVVTFSSVYGILFMSRGVDTLMKEFLEDETEGMEDRT